MKQHDIYYEALRTRDPRFDGKFFVGVKTTGIFCRPICPAKPKRENVEFFANRPEAERAGYRPCLRCRPESAPESPAWIGKSAIVRRAVKILNRGDAIRFDEDRFAEAFGVSARHLRRLFVDEIGKTPKQLAFENRLNLARKLIVETSLPISEAALAAGFRSIRRFNDAFRDRFKKRPGEIRRSAGAGTGGLRVTLPYRPPFNYEALLASYESHRIGNLERFADGRMFRVVEFGGKIGEIAIGNDPANSRLEVEIDFPDTSAIHSILSRVRILFDLDSDPLVVANSLETDRKAKMILRKHAGIRVPTGWDPFELAIGTILGQLVSIDRGRALVADLVDLLGRDSGRTADGRPVRLFPTPEAIANSNLDGLKTTGMRKRTLIAFSRAIVAGEISLEPTQDVDRFVEKVSELPGIGPWTASYMCLKVLRHADAFPSTDLILARALEIHPPESIARMSPWRGYAAALLWREYTHTLKKKKKA